MVTQQILAKAHTLDTIVHAVGMVEDHVHVVLSIPPKHPVWFCTVSLMPLLTHSLKQLYANKLYFQHCKLCGRLFLARTANIPTFCSAECKREQGRLNKQQFDEQARELDYEKEYKNTYMFWLRSVQGMKM